MKEIERIQEVYSTRDGPESSETDSIWHPMHPVSVYYRQAKERALIELFRGAEVSLRETHFLDVGCGSGGLLRFLATLGARPEHLCGLDLMPNRIESARHLCPPQTILHIGSGSALPYPDQRFDLVSQFTVLSSILDSHFRKQVAAEMVRVLRFRGHILWYDMRRVRSDQTRGIEIDEIRQLFPTLAIRATRTIHPPRATSLASRSRLLCELWDLIALWGKTHYLLLLQKEPIGPRKAQENVGLPM